MIENNNVELLFEARSENEAFARGVAAAFVTYLDPTIEELQDIKTAVSEAVTNAIVHGYDNGPGKVRMRLKGIQNQVIIEVHDDGLGIENVAKAMEPLYTTKPEQERSGMGFSFMEAFMDDLRVASAPGKGTTVLMRKKIGVPPFGWFMGVVGKKLKAHSIEAQALWSDTMSMVEETLGGLRIIKAFCAEEKMNKRFNQVNSSYRDNIMRVNIRQQMAHPMSEFLGTILIVVVLWFGGILVLDYGRIDGPTIIFYLVMLYSIINPLKEFSKASYNIPKGL